MKQYTESINRYIEYFAHSQNVVSNTVSNKWFEEFYQEPYQDEIRAAFKGSVDCGTRSATKQMLDDQAQIDRARAVRNKSRADFFVAARTRYKGIIFNLEKKKVFLSDRIG